MRTSKLLSWIFIATFLLTSIAYASDFEIEKNADMTCAIVGYKGKDAVVDIPTSIAGYTVTTIGDYAFGWCDSLTSITIPDSVTTIGDSAFSGCSDLANITVDVDNQNFAHIRGVLFDKINMILRTYPAGKSATSYAIPEGILSIGKGAFSGCDSLTGITIPDSVTAIGEWAFSGCSSLRGVTIPDSVTTIGDCAFGWCDSLTSITIPDSVTTIGEDVFFRCNNLSEIKVKEHSYAYEFFMKTKYEPLLSYRPSWLK